MLAKRTFLPLRGAGVEPLPAGSLPSLRGQGRPRHYPFYSLLQAYVFRFIPHEKLQDTPHCHFPRHTRFPHPALRA